MSTALRGAIVGFGNVAECGHLPAWQARAARGQMQIVAVAEPAAQRRQQARKLLPAALVGAEVQQILRDPTLDFVDIAAPPALHTDLIVAAANAGLHILCEKPLAVSAADYRRQHAAVERAGVTLFTVHNWKYSEPFRRVRALLDTGAIGPLATITFETTRDGCARTVGSNWRTHGAVAGGGILVDHGWHAFYLMLGLANERPRAIRAQLARRRYLTADVEDSALCTIEFPSLTGRLELTWAGRERRTRWQLQGRDGRIEVTDDRVSLHRRGRQESFTCAQSLSAGSHHPEWFAAVIDAFHREITDPAVRGENLAEAEQCVQLLSLAYASHADDARTQPLPATAN
ncbi:MAG: Gfo/Idh/MocA family oxidoreductase [Deltaproteobacteria bacterium]|nr:Gfo/Idh/MocA family oxidoreductase [Deltaproteobacteria bacterium]